MIRIIFHQKFKSSRQPEHSRDSGTHTQTVQGLRLTTETPREDGGYYGELPSDYEMERQILKGYGEVSK